MRYTRTALGLLNAQYRSVLKKCFLINMGLFALGVSAANANDYSLSADDLSTSKNITWKEISAEEYNPDNKNMLKVDISADKSQYFEYTYTKPEGGTVYTERQTNLTGDIGSETEKALFNGVNQTSDSIVLGGAISNSSNDSHNIYADFVGSYASSSADNTYGGAIYNRGTLGNITGNFVNNYAKSENAKSNGGAIYNYNTIGDVAGDFVGNYVNSAGDATGGAIFNFNTAGNIKGNFISNYVKSENGETFGGAIHNGKILGNVSGNFIGNYAYSSLKSASGGAIYNSENSGNLTGDFIGNYASSLADNTYGGAIYNRGTLGNITGNFIGNYVSSTNNTYGGAIYNHDNTIGSISGNFVGNFAKSENGEALGGAIYNSGTLTITGETSFTDNYVEKNGKKTSNAIYNSGIINLQGTNIVINDAINGWNTGNINITGIDDGITALNNTVSGNTINLMKGTLKLGHYNSTLLNTKYIGTFTDDVNFVVSGGALTTQDGETNKHNLGKLQLDADLNTAMDVDLANAEADVFSSTSTNGQYSLILNDIKVVSDTSRHIIKVKVADKNIKDKMALAEAAEKLTTADNTYLVEYETDETSGNLKIGNIKALETAVQFKKAATDFALDDDTTIESNLGALQHEQLNVNGNGHTVDGAGFGGMSVANGQTVSLNDVNIKNFGGAFVSNRGNLSINNTNMSNNGVQKDGGLRGGAVYNVGSTANISGISGNFENNYLISNNNNAYGGAILNDDKATIGDISGKFIENFAETKFYDRDGYVGAEGGAIANWSSTINNISGEFNSNHTKNIKGNGAAVGGAVANRGSGKINNINAVFNNNYAESVENVAQGGAIYNYDKASIGDISGKFSGNYVSSKESSTSGAILNMNSTIGNITADFENNHAYSEGYVYGGALANLAVSNYSGEVSIKDVIGNFTNNYAQSVNGYAEGGAISNSSASMGNIKGDFSGNYTLSEKSSSSGGAIYNYNSVLNDINGSFIGNYAKSKRDSTGYFGSMGGAIYNVETSIKNIIGNFVDNYAEVTEGSSAAGGGAIYNRNTATIEKLQGNFENNSSRSEKNTVYGGAILNWDKSPINEIEGDFSKNHVVSIESGARGGAIDNASSTIGNITGKFTGNYAQSENGQANGGVIYNYKAQIGDIKGNFSDNYAISTNNQANGGAVNNIMGTISSITGNFSNNSVSAGARATGGAINNNNTGVIKTLTGNFINNSAKSTGGAALARAGAILNLGTINSISGDFENNYAETNGTFSLGGAILNNYWNDKSTGIGKLAGNFKGNYAKTTGTGEDAYAQGGAIYNAAQMNIDDIASSSFIGNYVSGADAKTDGGAIWNAGNITFSGASEFTGNYAEQGGTKRSNAIYNEGTINFNSGDIVLNDAVTGNGGTINLAGQITENSASDVIAVNNQVSGNTLNLTQGLLKLGSYNSAEFGKSVGTFADDVNFVVSGGALTAQDGETNEHNLGNLQLDADLNTAMDVDLANVKADVFGGAGANGEHSLILNDIKAVSDTERHILKVKVADENIKDKMTLAEASEKLTTADNIYLVEYETDETSGNLKFGNVKALETGVQFKKADKDFEMSEDAVIETDLGALKNDGLNIIGNNHTIDGSGFGGMTISGGQTASLSDATVKGFDGAFAENNGTLNIISNTETNLASAISGTGTINADGAGKLNVKAEISGNTLNLNQGTLSFGRDENGNMGSFADDVNFAANGGALSLTDNETNDHNLGNLQLNENLNTALDVDLANKKADTMTGSSEAVSSNGSKVLIDNINIIADGTNHIIKVRVADNNLKNSTALADDVTVVMNPTDTNSYLIVYETDDLGGNLKFGNVEALETAVQFENANKVFAMGKDFTTDTNLGSLVGDKLTISGNGHTVDGAGLGGMTIANGQTVSLNDVTIKNFGGAFAENNGTMNIKSNTSTNLESQISGTGTINVGGEGNFNLNSDITAGSMNMNSGSYNLNGNITADNMHVSGGEFNLAEGTELAEVNNFVADGGVLNVGDQTIKLKNATFNDGSTVKINVKDNGNGLLKADNLVINGGDLKASLGQGIVDLTNKQKIVTLLESGTDFTDNFASVADNNMYRFEKAEKAGDYIISLIKTAEDVSRENNGTENNANEAKAWVDGSKFTEGSVSADLADNLADLAQNNAEAFNEALSALAPSDTPIVRTTSVNHSVESFSAVTSHLNETYQKNKLGLSSGDSYIYNGVSAWARAFGNHTKVDDNSKSYGFSSDNYGVSLGVDKQLSMALKVGAGYSYFANDISGFMRDSDVDTHAGFVYAEYRPNDWYINAVASYGYSEYDETKHVAGNSYKGKFDVDNLGAQVMTGYNAKVAETDVTPEIGLRYNNIHRDDYVDGAGQAVKAETMDVMTAVADVKVGKDLVSCIGTHSFYWRPEARLAATYDFISDKEDAVVTLPNGSGYFVNGQRLNRFGIEAGAGVTFYLTPRVESSVGYEGKFRKDYADHTGYVSAKYKF